MQKSLIVLVVGLLAVGCATVKDICVQLGISKPNTPEQNQKTLRDSVVGEYGAKYKSGTTYKYVFLDNGIEESYRNGKKQGDGKWSIVKGEIQVKYDSGAMWVWRINTDTSITGITWMNKDGKQTDVSNDGWTFKKIK